MDLLHFAPVQGHTDAAYRHFHSKVYGGNQIYYTPFIRLEKNDVRARDLRDFTSDLNKNTHLIPQIIFRDYEELVSLIKRLKSLGAKEINLNMGCPFPLQTGHGRGAATILNEEIARDVVKVVKENEDVAFSVKMRLGLTEPEEWKNLIHNLNQIELSNIILHPRVAKQQYSGDIDLEQFQLFLKVSRNPTVYNGDLHSPEDLTDIKAKFPDLSGVMIGRGILARPSLFEEFTGGFIMGKEERLRKMLDFHRLLFNHYQSILCGDSQILSKIKPFWEYSEQEIGRKAWKAIKKASNIAKYQSAVALINP